MSFNIFDAVKGHFGSELIGKAASFLGESESGISKAIGGILPTVLSGLNSKAGTSEGANEVMNMASSAHSTGILGSIGSFFGGGDMLSKGAGLLTSLFGGKLGGIVDTISNFAGIKGDSINKLMSMAAPVALGSLGKHAAETGLGASGIASLLSSSSSSWSSMLPSGLGSLLGGAGAAVTGAVGAVSGGLGNTKDKAAGYASGAGHAVEEAASGGAMKWLLPLLLLGGLGAGAWYFWKNKKADDTHTAQTPEVKAPETPTPNTSTPAATDIKVMLDSATGVVKYDLGAEKEFDLGNGTKIKAAENGFEGQLINFIKNGTIDAANKSANWFNLYNVQFVKGKSNAFLPNSGSEVQISNTAAILKAYPNVKIKLGGYTDSDGNAAGNKTLSDARAKFVQSSIVAGGAKAEQIVEAVGYGADFAVAPNDSKENMARNRRVAAKVDAK
jgi:outer membrane protein OmpA-like peptidoglycan-associated protein